MQTFNLTIGVMLPLAVVVLGSITLLVLTVRDIARELRAERRSAARVRLMVPATEHPHFSPTVSTGRWVPVVEHPHFSPTVSTGRAGVRGRTLADVVRFMAIDARNGDRMRDQYTANRTNLAEPIGGCEDCGQEPGLGCVRGCPNGKVRQ